VFAQQVLDAGALGIIVPMVNDAADAARAIGACRYPPLGYRSNGANRARFLGPDYFAGANSEIACLVQIETAEAVQNLENMAILPGLDGFYVGPSDLAISMGLEPRLDHPDPGHAAAVQKVVDAGRKHGLVCCIHVTGPEEAARRWRQGFNFNPICTDAGMIGAGAARAIADFRKGVQG
jgi:4-hydroxy-2-oxoheptanedioate aldolase